MNVLKTSILCLLFTCAFTVAAKAQDIPPGVPLIKVAPLKPIPAAVTKRMPKGSESLFFGVARRGYHVPSLALHIFNAKNAPEDFSKPSSDAIQSCTLNLFSWRHEKGRNLFTRVNSVRFNYNGRGCGGEVLTDLLWLYPRTKHIPLIAIDFRGSNIEGLWGTTVLVAFPNGITGRASTQEFIYGSDNSSDHEGYTWYFAGKDLKGLLTIESEFGSRYLDETTLWVWNGRAMVAVKDEIRKHY